MFWIYPLHIITVHTCGIQAAVKILFSLPDLIEKGMCKTKNPSLKENAGAILFIELRCCSWKTLLWSDKKAELNGSFEYPIIQVESGSQ